MSDLTGIAGEMIGTLLAHPAVGVAARLGAAYLVILWLAAAWWTWRDARSRTGDPLLPYLAVAGVMLVTPVLFPLAVVVYRIVRPALTVADARVAALQHAMLEEGATTAACRECGTAAEPDWVACPGCGADLAVRCAACGRPQDLDWRICAWCAADVPWEAPDAKSIATSIATEPVAIPIRPGGRPLVPVMAAPEPVDAPVTPATRTSRRYRSGRASS